MCVCVSAPLNVRQEIGPGLVRGCSEQWRLHGAPFSIGYDLSLSLNLPFFRGGGDLVLLVAVVVLGVNILILS